MKQITLSVTIDDTPEHASKTIIVTCANCKQTSQESYSTLMLAFTNATPVSYDFLMGSWYHRECPPQYDNRPYTEQAYDHVARVIEDVNQDE